MCMLCLLHSVRLFFVLINAHINFGFVDRWARTETTQEDKTGAVTGHFYMRFSARWMPSQRRFITTEQHKMQQELSTFEERQPQTGLKDRELKKEEAEERRASSRENKQLLADTLRQLLQPAQPALQPAFNQVRQPHRSLPTTASITTNHRR